MSALIDQAARQIAKMAGEHKSMMRRQIARATKREAEALMAKGPCYRQDKLLATMYGNLRPFGFDFLPGNEEIQKHIAHELKMRGACSYGHDFNRLIALRGHLLARRYERRIGSWHG